MAVRRHTRRRAAVLGKLDLKMGVNVLTHKKRRSFCLLVWRENALNS